MSDFGEILYFDGKVSSIQRIEKFLGFRYLKKNAFETPHARLCIKAKGIERLRAGQISAKSFALGRQFQREIQSAYLPHASIRWVNHSVGYGLFAEEELSLGAFAGEYTGIVRENNRLYTEPLNNYCYEYPVLDSIGRSFVIDASHGNITRFINHSYTPNLQPLYAFIDGFYHCIFIAMHFIAKGSQLSYNYGTSYWYLRGAPQEILPRPL